MVMKKCRLAVFASGSGSNYEAIAEACRDGRIDAEVVLLVCDKPGAKVLERAQRLVPRALCLTPRIMNLRRRMRLCWYTCSKSARWTTSAWRAICAS